MKRDDMAARKTDEGIRASAPERTPERAAEQAVSILPVRMQIPFAVLTGVLMVLAFPRYGAAYHLDHLVWVTFLPLFLAALGVGGRRGFFLGWIAGMTLECAGFVWILYSIRSFANVGNVLAALGFLIWVLYSSLPWAVLGWALGRSRNSLGLVWVTLLWVGIEQFYPRLFPWHVGGALYARTWLLQCVDLLGASGLTALTFLTSAMLLRVIEARVRRRRLPWGTIAFTASLLAAALIYGKNRLDEMREIESNVEPLRVGFVQGNFDPRTQRAPGEEVDVYLDRSEALVRRDSNLDLLVWPEMIHRYPFDLDAQGIGAWRSVLAARGMREGRRMIERYYGLGVPLVAGGGTYRGDPSSPDCEYFNSVFYIQGKTPARPRFYHKAYLVPFGEQVPGLDLLPESWRKRLGNIGNFLSAGTENELFDLRGHPFRNLICYEVVMPGYVRRSSEGASFLVNSTEDIWYGRTAHIPQHLSVLILRSVENRTPVVRCTNIGPSGICRLTGEFRGTDKIFEPDLFVEDLVPVRVATMYGRGGFLFPLFGLLLGGIGVLSTRGRPSQGRSQKLSA